MTTIPICILPAACVWDRFNKPDSSREQDLIYLLKFVDPNEASGKGMNHKTVKKSTAYLVYGFFLKEKNQCHNVV